MTENSDDRPQPLPLGELRKSEPVIVPFDQLSEGHNEVIVEYRGQFYRLRTTRNGKLILNK